MFVRYNSKVINLEGCTSFANKEGKLSVFYGDKTELIGTFPVDVAEKHLEKIYNALASGEAAITL